MSKQKTHSELKPMGVKTIIPIEWTDNFTQCQKNIDSWKDQLRQRIEIEKEMFKLKFK
jgi:hypothetical protein